ncbi:hypothetical protein M3Y95_01128200 [Aphelenchoides besseyi]|nr:hypothetical protein M3Y95_01128200 [Aphelenchoides besseyi]
MNSDAYHVVSPPSFELVNSQSNELPPPRWLIWVVIVEISVIILSCLWSIFIAKIFIARPIFHINVIGITTNVFLGNLLMNLSRLCVCIAALFDKQILADNRSIFLTEKPFMYVEMFRIASGCSAVALMSWIMVERIIALIKLASYEKTTSKALVAVAVISSWGVGIFIGIFIYGSLFDIILCLVLAACLSVFTGTSYIAINRWNSNRLRNSRRNTTALSLTQRYQLRETIWLLAIIRRWILAFFAGMTIVIVTFAIGLLSHKKSDSNTIFYVRSVGNVFCALGGTSMLTAAITGCHAWREDIKKNFRKCRARRVTEIQPQRRVLTNFRGQQLLFDVVVERDLHFGQLQEAWK